MTATATTAISPNFTAPSGPGHRSPSLDPLAKMRGESRGGAILSEDSLTTYMNQLRRIEVLPEQRQNELARAFVEEGDEEAGKTLIWTNLRLVVSIAKDFHRSSNDLMELIQQGNLGLSEALTRFDPERGTPFVGYAHYWIRAMILNYLLNQTHPVRLGSSRDSRKLFFNLKKARRAVSREGLEPTPENVAEYLDVDPDEVVRVGQLMDSGGVVYLDAPCFDDEEAPARIDRMEADGPAPEQEATDRVFRDRMADLVDQFEQTLPDERRVTIWRERMIAAEPRYLKDLGAQYDVSKERIRQIEMGIRRRFRAFLQKHLGDELQDVLPN